MSAATVQRRGIVDADSRSEPYVVGEGPVGCLMIHGWSGHPGDLRPMADYLAARGLTVAAPRLPGHGGDAEEMASVSFRRWIAAVGAAWTALRREHPTSFVVGLSMGGALALDLAARRPGEMHGVVTMGALTYLGRGWQSLVLPVGRFVVRWHYPLAGADLSDAATRERVARMLRGVDLDWDDPATAARVRTMTRVSVGAAYQLQLLVGDVRRRLPRVRDPLLIMHGRLDDVVTPRCALDIQARAGSADKELVWLDQSRHLLPLDVDHQEVWERTWRFIEARVPHNDG